MGHFLLLRRYSGDTSFGWGVATYAPMAVLIAGVGPWIRWSDSVVSWELGLAIVLISFVSMEMALRSNRALNFVVVAVAACIVPIIYEVLNTNAPDDGMGGALSLMVFIIALQGYYASRQDLRKGSHGTSISRPHRHRGRSDCSGPDRTKFQPHPRTVQSK